MIDRPAGYGEALGAYRREVLRWNSQINLVSRRDTEAQLDALIRQCEAAFDAVAARCPDLFADGLLYGDLGAGGGLPGIIWHLCRQAAAGESWLVEPRDKRAWFLQRVARLLGLDRLRVAAARWSETAPDDVAPAPVALISLKALRLTDPEVLGGLEIFRGGVASLPARTVIVRFHPGDTVWTPELADELGVAAPGRRIGPWAAVGAEVVPVHAPGAPATALVIARYARASS